MAQLTEVVENDLTRLSVVLLPSTGGVQATRTRAVIDIETAGAVTAGSVTSTLGVVATTDPLYRGSVIRFPGDVTVVLALDAPVGATSLVIVPQDFELADASDGETYGEAELYGADNAGVSTSTGEVDVSSFGDGVDFNMLTVSVSREIPVSGIYTTSGVMQDIMRPLGMNSAFAKREVYFVLTLGDGSGYEGVARLTNYTETAAFRDTLKFTATLKIQGSLTTNAAPAA